MTNNLGKYAKKPAKRDDFFNRDAAQHRTFIGFGSHVEDFWEYLLMLFFEGFR